MLQNAAATLLLNASILLQNAVGVTKCIDCYKTGLNISALYCSVFGMCSKF